MLKSLPNFLLVLLVLASIVACAYSTLYLGDVELHEEEDGGTEVVEEGAGGEVEETDEETAPL